MQALHEDEHKDKKINISFQSWPLKTNDNYIISTVSPFCTSTLESKYIRLPPFIQNHQIATQKSERRSQL